MVAITKDKVAAASAGVASSPLPSSLSDLYGTKRTYAHVAADFHKFHEHDVNCAIHLVTTTLGLWGVLQLVLLFLDDFGGPYLVYGYAALVALTTPLTTGVIHTALIYGCMQFATSDVVSYVVNNDALGNMKLEGWQVAVVAVVAGYGLQDVSHYLCVEPTFMDSYLKQGKGWMLIVHSFWLLPLVIDSILMRQFFLPYVVTRNRNVVCASVTSRDAVTGLRDWIHANVPSTPETTHVWPHERDVTAKATLQLEHDAAIEAGFRSVFPAKHFDVKPVQDMNEIYVTAVGAKKAINSDAVFYTPHVDGPFWFLPSASLYRVLVGLTPNEMVRTRFNLQHETQDQVLNMYGVVGFDYNRELHWIDHVPDAPKNGERRSVLKLHFIVYPRGWHWYGNFCANANATYNTWARGNFLTTLRPKGLYEYAMAWWIWLTTWFNAGFEEIVGWDNVVYITTAYLLGPVPFLLLTSFRHYAVYMTTFAFRKPMVAHGYLMRDAKIYKTIAMMHLGRRLWPMVEFPRDIPGLVLSCLGFSLTILATARLGMVRTYFGTELGFVKPEWIHGFPYGSIPHPMIVGQLAAFGTILLWWRNQISQDNAVLLLAHMGCYTAHMVQEMLFSAY